MDLDTPEAAQPANENPAASYTVHTPVYDGPLDLLLDLIERAELEITSLSLAMVTDQYLAYLHSMGNILAEDISYFLVIAAKLLQIKSEALLPRPPIREPGEEDVGEDLARQLRVYKRFKEIGEWLHGRSLRGLRTYLHIAPTHKVETRLDLSNITIADLLAAAEAIFIQEQDKAALGTVITPPRVTIREKIRLIARQLQSHRRVTFNSLIRGTQPTRLEVVMTFLALLELVKRFHVAARQEDLFSDIEIVPLEEWQADEEFELEFGE